MYDYQDEVKAQVADFFSKIVLPLAVPAYFSLSLIDWLLVPSFALSFLCVRLTILPVVGFFSIALRKKWPGPWYCLAVWICSLTASVQLSYMAWQTGHLSSSLYLYCINLIAGVLLIFPMRLLQNLVTLFMVYSPPAVILTLKFFSSDEVPVTNIPMLVLTGGMIYLFIFAATALDRLRYRAFLQKVNLFFLATTDILSGLKLRHYFFNRFVQEMSLCFRRGKALCLSVMIIDIDDFKDVNAQRGYEVGDKCIKHIGGIIKNHIRIYDTGCRFGGEEFILLLPETGLEGAKIVAERIRHSVEMMPLIVNGEEVKLTVSVGLSALESKVPENYTDIQRNKDTKLLVVRNMLGAIRKADEALHEAKWRGKNCVAEGGPVPLCERVEESEMADFKSYLVYFDQDLFLFRPEETFKAAEEPDEEINFYPQEFFFRRCVESLSRYTRSPDWLETLALIRVKHPEQEEVKRLISKMFRATDVLCVLNHGLYGVIFFALEPYFLNKTLRRVKQHLSEALKAPKLEMKMAASVLRYEKPSLRFSRKRNQLPVYQDLARYVSELFQILKGHRFSDEEEVFFYIPPFPKKSLRKTG